MNSRQIYNSLIAPILIVLLAGSASTFPVFSRLSDLESDQALVDLDTRQTRQVDENCPPGEECNSSPATENNTRNSAERCDSLEVFLMNQYKDAEFRQVLFPNFVYPEVYLDRSQTSTTLKQMRQTDCEDLEIQLNNQIPKTGVCSWAYSCTYIPNEYPSFRIEVDNCTVRNEALSHPYSCRTRYQDVKIGLNSNGCWNSLKSKPIGVGCDAVSRTDS